MSTEKKQARSRAKPKNATAIETKTTTSGQKTAKSQRAPSAYSEHMRGWMRQYKSSGFSGSTKEYFAAGARGWKDKKTVAETMKEVKSKPEKKEAEKSTE